MQGCSQTLSDPHGDPEAREAVSPSVLPEIRWTVTTPCFTVLGACRSQRHGDEAPGGQERAPAQGRAPGGGTAAVHGPHERPPLPLPRLALHLAPALHGGPHALSLRPLQDGADEQLLPVAVLRAAEDRSEADEACRGRSREESESLAHCPGQQVAQRGGGLASCGRQCLQLGHYPIEGGEGRKRLDASRSTLLCC